MPGPCWSAGSKEDSAREPSTTPRGRAGRTAEVMVVEVGVTGPLLRHTTLSQWDLQKRVQRGEDA